MRRRLFGSVTALLAGVGAAAAQTMPVAPSPAPLPLQPAPGSAAPPALAAPVPSATPCATCDSTMAGATRGNERPASLPGSVYGDAEYLLWFAKGQNLPPLVTRGRVGNVLDTAALGFPGTVTLYGDDEVDGDLRSGGRLRAGVWLNSCQTVGVEASGFFMERIGSTFRFRATDGATVVGRPFVNADRFAAPADPMNGIGAVEPESALLLQFPGQFSGTVAVRTATSVWGADALGRFNVAGNCGFRADLLAGFRYLSLNEDLEINSTVTPTPGGALLFRGRRFFTGSSLAVRDAFRTENDFYGGHLGGHIELQRGMWYVDLRGGLGLGVVRSTSDIRGSSVLTNGGVRQPATGGLLAQTTNIGTQDNNEFAIVPEASLTVGCQVSDHVRAFIGYSAIYWRNSVLRPASEIDRRVNASQIPSSPAFGPVGTETFPAVQRREVDFWLQGVHLGFEVGF